MDQNNLPYLKNSSNLFKIKNLKKGQKRKKGHKIEFKKEKRKRKGDDFKNQIYSCERINAILDNLVTEVHENYIKFIIWP